MFSGKHDKYRALRSDTTHIAYPIIHCVATLTLYRPGLSAPKHAYALCQLIFISRFDPYCFRVLAEQFHRTCWSLSSHHCYAYLL